MAYRISPTSISRIINETCEAIWTVMLSNDILKVPTTEDEWRQIAHDFESKWNFDHCVGAIDGKHVAMQAPHRSGSMFFNYKKTHSIVLMAVCDANYLFTMVDIGDTGRNSDGGVFSNSALGQCILENRLHLPPDEEIEQTSIKFPYVFVRDEAFPLKVNIMKPYPAAALGFKEQIYNYRLSRARRIIENCFGIAASQFRIFRRPIIAKVDTVVKVTKAVVALHNFCMIKRPNQVTLLSSRIQ